MPPSSRGGAWSSTLSREHPRSISPPKTRPSPNTSSSERSSLEIYPTVDTVSSKRSLNAYFRPESTSTKNLAMDGAQESADFDLNLGSISGDSEQELEDDVCNPTFRKPIYSHPHSRSYTSLGPSAFAPPFYNRPPTPLPPSPSLTSLLRPTFSRHNSRPNTPDLSSDDGNSHPQPNGHGIITPASAAASTLTSSFRTAKPIPRASPRVPTYEYYGFTLYLTSSLAFIVYVLWSFLPSPFLHQLGIYYYPNRWWALAIPAWTVMLICYVYVALASYNTTYLTLNLRDVECLVDEAASVAVVDSKGVILKGLHGPSWSTGVGDERLIVDDDGLTFTGNRKSRARARASVAGSRSNSRPASISQAKPELDWRELWNEGTDAVMDMPLGGVCQILYGDGGRKSSD